MEDSDLYMEGTSPPEDSVYPDIDETLQYPWQGSQPSAAGDVHASVIDPRLYRDLFAQNAPEEAGPAYSEDEDADEEAPSEEEQTYLYDGDVTDDSDYVFAEDQSTSAEEEDELAEDDDDNDSVARRRRRRGGGRFSGRYGARGGKGIRRGPRRPIEPSPEFKMLHSEATSAFIDGDYDRAIDLVKRAILINPEMFAAHSLLSEIFLAQGQKDKALTALFSGAHTRPKDPTVWAKVARLIMERVGENRKSVLNDVIYCYSRVIDIEPRNFNIRFQRAAIYRELGYNGRAAGEYERILKERPHNARALRHLAETYIDLDDVQKAVDHYADSVEYFMSHSPEESLDFGWSDVNIYVELYSYLNQHQEGLTALKGLSRWLLGRKDDIMWEDFDEDDREWDFDDSPRRIKTDGYIPGQWPLESYGLGLPLELRIKMGLFRLKMGDQNQDEALHHFEWLNPEDTSEGARIFDYGDLFREVADALKETGVLEEALRYYAPIQQTTEYADVGYFMAIAGCCMDLGKVEDAEHYYLIVAGNDATNMESRVQLAKLYESLGMSEQAFKYVNEAVLIGRQESRTRRKRKDTRLEQLAMEFRMAEAGEALKTPGLKAPSTTLTTLTAGRGQAGMGEGSRTEDIQFLYSKMQQLEPRIKEGAAEAIEDWLDIADALLRDFRSNRIFYPMLRSITFQGYSVDAHKKGKSKSRMMMDEMQEMAGRLQESLGEVTDESLLGAIPTDYHGISFDDWLDIFLQYALLSTEQGESEEAYEALNGAAMASVWLHSQPKTRLIHVCWFTCALRAQDEEALSNEARWFIKEYQFVTDTYRLFSMLSHLSGDPHRSLFHSSPNMKFMLRQIKAMDFTLPDVSRPQPSRPSIWKERAALSTKDEFGEPIPAKELDIALLVLYGHILYSGNSFYPALNYFFRAYALDDQNPAVLLSISLCYIHHALKRQSENRHYLIMQGLSFMHEYRLVREKPGTLLQERQEMEFNFARVYHALSLVHLAIKEYELVLVLGEKIQREQHQQESGEDAAMSDGTGPSQAYVEDFSRDAAFALQNLHALSGDLRSAQAVTNKWLVI
ncbi:Tetratricopeptide-like helical [Penicillium riverlandense]|uniref:Tetratricopeptide-like helical n=1 Tax=Penicillium riverlandense TaxID=1903569 RepID=UPI00254946B0|nr:Tetratricopeptide-like helical [Penicillium riverlandense]KAJ5807796.1 Tetratricopeptide-like helical [Penicillium riverlandense]